MAYRGISARLPVGAQGFTGTINQSRAGPGHFTFVEGVELDGGIIRKDGGAQLYNAANPVHGGLLDSFVKVQIHFNGPDAGIALPDTNGVTNRTWTPAGNAQLDTAAFKFGPSSGLFDGTGDWFTAPDSADFTLGSGPFTCEFWFNCNAAGGTLLWLCGQQDGAGTATSMSFQIFRTVANVISAFVCVGSSTFSVVGTTQFTNAVNPGWHHCALIRTGDTGRLFLDGVQEGGDFTITGTVNDSTNVFGIGITGAAVANGWNGWIDEFRLSVGVARWTANFTPPTAAYADYSAEPSRAIVADFDTKALVHFDGTDAATATVESSLFQPRTYTFAGNAQLDNAQAKFGVTSVLFDGTGDIVSAPDSNDWALSNNPFTIDLWFFCNVAGGTVLNLCGQTDAGLTAAGSAFQLGRTAGNVIQLNLSNGAGFTAVTGTTQFTNAVNTGWHHVAVVRTGNILRMFIDGVQEGGDVAFSGSVPDVGQVLVIGGRDAAAANPWNGWIDEFRFVNGIAKWITAFIPPTAPYIVNGSNSQLTTFGTLPTGVQQILAGIHWGAIITGIQNNIIATSGGLILAASAGGFSGLCRNGLVSLDTDPPPYFMFGGGEAVGSSRKLFMFSKNNQVQMAPNSGSTPPFANISTPPADWSGAGNFPTFGVLHAFRVFGGGNASDPHRIYYSTSTNHQDFTGAGSGQLAIYPGEGDKIVGGISFRGALILWKYPSGVYVVTTTDPTPTNWRVDRLTKAVGTVNQHAIVQIENDVSFLDKSGNIHLLSAVNEFGDLNTSNLTEVSDVAPFIRTNIALANIQRAVGTWYPAKRQLWYGLNRLASGVNNLRLQVGFAGLQQQPQQQIVPPVFFMSRRDVELSLWLHPDNFSGTGIPKPMIGDDQGFVWYLDQDARNKNGVAYPIQFQTASTDLAFIDPSLATKQKNGEFLELAYEPKGDWDLTVDIFWDDVYVQTIFYDMGGSGGTLGSFVLDTDILGGEGPRSRRQRMEGSGRRFRLSAQNTGLNEDVTISEFHMNFSVGDERVQE